MIFPTSKKAIIFSVLILCCLSFYFLVNYYYLNEKIVESSNVINETTNVLFLHKPTKKLPLILAYTPFWKWSILQRILQINSIEKCKYKCQFSENKSLYSTSDAVIFHGPQIKMDKILLTNKNPNRLNIFFSRESPGGKPLPSKNIPKDFFNITMTFRRDSTIFKPYDRFEDIEENERNNIKLMWTENQINEAMKIKTKLVIIANSHCPTNSKREIYIDALNKILNITLYGNCYNTKKIEKKAFNEEINKHYFYLAFENNVCKDYITEKFWRIKQLIVPVVLKRSILRGIVDDKYFIAADDFASPKELADRLIYLSKNHTEYRKFFDWTKKYKKSSGFDEREMCQLCEMISKKEKHSITDIYKWWENQGKCIPNFAKTIV